MSSEKIIGQILSRHPEISREDIEERLEIERRRTDGLISDETLLWMIAAEFSVEVPQHKAVTPTLSIKDLIPSLNDISLVGRVVAVFSPRAFKGTRSGEVASLLVTDRTGVLRVVLWNDKASFIRSDKIKVGQIVRFFHAYTREDRSGKVELHVGEKSEIQVDPDDVEAKDYPTIAKFATKIGHISLAFKNKRINVAGTVKDTFSASSFQRKDSSFGKVMRFTLTEETGEIPVVVWNEKVNELEKKLRKGAQLQVVNAKVKTAIGRSLEIHVDAETYVETLKPEEEFLKIVSLRESLGRVNVEGTVVTKPIFRNVKTSEGEAVKLANFEFGDETGRIWVSAWRMHADALKDVKAGDKVIIKNAYVKKGFGDQLELSTRNTTSIVKDDSKNQD
jgi:ssDNA-binding replication factor A large subunit